VIPRGENVRNCSKKRTITIALQHLDRFVRQRNTLLLERLEARIEMRKGEFEAEAGGQRFEDAAACWDDFAANAVAGNEACMGSIGCHKGGIGEEGGCAPMRSVRAAILNSGE